MNWRDAAKANIEADAWVTPLPQRNPPFPPYEGVKLPVQESYAEVLHPRDRRGRWIPKLGGVRQRHDLQDDFNDLLGSRPQIAGPDKPLPVHYSAEVRGIHTEEDMRRVLGAHGVLLPPHPPFDEAAWRERLTKKLHALTFDDAFLSVGGYQVHFTGAWGDEEWHAALEYVPPGPASAANLVTNASFDEVVDRIVEDLKKRKAKIHVTTMRGITQAVIDAQDRWPVLRSGSHPLTEVTFMSWMPVEDPDFDGVMLHSPGVLATTSIDDPGMSDGSTTRSTHMAYNDWADFDTAGLLDPNENHDEAARKGNNMMSTATVYGRVMHEMGHVFWFNTAFPEVHSKGGFGLASTLAEDSLVDLLNEHDLDPREFGRVSKYGASSPAEAWADLFAFNMVPGYVGWLSAHGHPDVANRLQQAYNEGTKAMMAEVGDRRAGSPPLHTMTGGPALAEALERARKNMEANDWRAADRAEEAANAGAGDGDDTGEQDPEDKPTS